jgi:hypothetical protein
MNDDDYQNAIVFFNCVGLYLHVVGEGCVRVRSRSQERLYDKENYIDFRIRLLGETGAFCIYVTVHEIFKSHEHD